MVKKIFGYIVIICLFAGSIAGIYFGIRFAQVSNELKSDAEYIEQIDDLQLELSQVNESLTEANNKYSLLVTENEQNKQTIADYTVLISEKDTQIQTLEGEKQSLLSQIEDLNEEHHKTGFPIVYTSADSVFQIAVDVDVVPLEKLYEYCKIAREILHGEHNVSRVIARPYRVIDRKPTRIGSLRHDYSVEPPRDTLLNILEKNNKKVLGIGKIYDIFVGSGVSEKILTKGNTDGLNKTLEAIKTSDADLIFVNLVDTDMLYGHRRDSLGYKKAIEEIDLYLDKFLNAITDDDMIIITADHGCDPTFRGTDHTREMVPYLMYSKNIEPQNLGLKESLSYVSEIVGDYLLK